MQVYFPYPQKHLISFHLIRLMFFSDLTLKCFFHSLILFSAPQVKYIVIPLYYNVYLTFYKFSNIYYTYFSVRLFLHFFPSLPDFFLVLKILALLLYMWIGFAVHYWSFDFMILYPFHYMVIYCHLLIFLKYILCSIASLF